MAKKKQAAEPSHELSTRISDNISTVWVECSCGFETSFYTIVGDGVEAMKAARDEAERHVSPKASSEEPRESEQQEPETRH